MRALAEEIHDIGSGFDGRIEAWVRAGNVGAKVDQIFRLAVQRESLANPAGMFGFFARGEFGLQPADGIQHLDGGVVTRGAQFAGKGNMTVQNGADGVTDWLIEVVLLRLKQ